MALEEPNHIVGICALDPEDDSSPASLRNLQKQYGIGGLRSLPASDGRINHPGVRNLWKACADSGITINASVKHEKAHELTVLLDEFASVRCVIDHCLLLTAGPSQGEMLDEVLKLSQYPNTFAKLSFLPMGSAEGYPYTDLHDSCRQIIAAYTPSRCVWGSAFPCELWTPRSTYRQNLHLITEELGLDIHAQEDILWNTPWRLWFENK